MCQYNNSLTRYSFSVLQCGAGFSYLDEYSAELVTAAAMDKDKRADNESES